MAGNIVRKPLEFVLIITVHIILNGPDQAEQADVITGIFGKNITLQFKFNDSIENPTDLAVYTDGERKISDYKNYNSHFEILPKNSSVLYHITNLTLNNSQVYWIILFRGLGPKLKSKKVKLIVQEESSSTTVPPKTTIPANNGNPSFFTSDAVTLLVVTSAVLLAAILSFFICCLVKTKDQETEPHRNSNPTVQETISTVEFSINVPGPSLVYSVLDFPRRPPAFVEFNPTDTEYACVSYLPEKRQI